MSKLFGPNQNILFMKVGIHAKEALEDIIDRKRREIDEAGYALWGYGGNTCHPTTKIQPFVQGSLEQGQPIFLCMQKIDSSHFAEPVRAEYFSPNGISYHKIPSAINVLGSRYALAIKVLDFEEFDLPLAKTVVSVGDCRGRPGNTYIKGRVDKACLTLVDDIDLSSSSDEDVAKISLVAELCEPYAVFLKN